MEGAGRLLLNRMIEPRQQIPDERKRFSDAMACDWAVKAVLILLRCFKVI